VRGLVGRLRGDESGVAMVVAMGVILLLTLITGVVLAASVQLSATSNTDTLRKRALEVAEAGLQATNYRLNLLAPSSSNCIGGSSETVQAPGTGSSVCPSYTESVGNSSSYTTWTTPVFSGVGTCAGVSVGTSSTVQERCVTSQGTVNGVSRRVQVRVAAYAAAPIFPVNGVIGLTSVTLDNFAGLAGTEASNGLISLNHGASATSTTLGPSAPAPSLKNGASDGTVTQRTAAQGNFVLSPVNPGNSATSNDDGRITNGLHSPPVSPSDPASGTVSFDASTRILSLSGGSTAGNLTLGGAVYNFCSLTLGNGATLTLGSGVRTVIFIDSPARPGSGCPSGSGTLTEANGANITNNSPAAPGSSIAHDTTALQIYVYGWPSSFSSSANVVSLGNSSSFFGTVYAPQSTISVNNSAAYYGAMAGNVVNFNNGGSFTGDNNDQLISSVPYGLYFRTAWHECLPAPTSSDPQSGC